MLKLLGIVGPVLRLVSGTLKPATDMISKAPDLLLDLAGKADKKPGQSSAGVLGLVVGYLGWDLGLLADVGAAIANVGLWVGKFSG